MPDEKLPKSLRLLKKKDFSFRPYRRFESVHFLFICDPKGKGRLGISIAKKVLKNAAQRNRIKRLIRESFRKNKNSFNGLDVHLVGREALKKTWEKQTLQSVTQEVLKAING